MKRAQKDDGLVTVMIEKHPETVRQALTLADKVRSSDHPRLVTDKTKMVLTVTEFQQTLISRALLCLAVLSAPGE